MCLMVLVVDFWAVKVRASGPTRPRAPADATAGAERDWPPPRRAPLVERGGRRWEQRVAVRVAGRPQRHRPRRLARVLGGHDLLDHCLVRAPATRRGQAASCPPQPPHPRPSPLAAGRCWPWSPCSNSIWTGSSSPSSPWPSAAPTSMATSAAAATTARSCSGWASSAAQLRGRSAPPCSAPCSRRRTTVARAAARHHRPRYPGLRTPRPPLPAPSLASPPVQMCSVGSLCGSAVATNTGRRRTTPAPRAVSSSPSFHTAVSRQLCGLVPACAKLSRTRNASASLPRTFVTAFSDLLCRAAAPERAPRLHAGQEALLATVFRTRRGGSE